MCLCVSICMCEYSACGSHNGVSGFWSWGYSCLWATYAGAGNRTLVLCRRSRKCSEQLISSRTWKPFLWLKENSANYETFFHVITSVMVKFGRKLPVFDIFCNRGWYAPNIARNILNIPAPSFEMSLLKKIIQKCQQFTRQQDLIFYKV